MMKLQQYITEASKVYYHATYKKFLPVLKREGIKARKKALHTNAFGGDVRDDKESVYAVTDEN
jgi:RNA:NAD 2'-phosphotransferase (TPT1/KptA family)